MHRYELSDPQWTRIAPLFPDPTHRGKPGRPRHHEHRSIINGILGILHTGAPWRDLPERYGPWQTVFDYFNLASRRHLESCRHLVVGRVG
jgi:transposase